METYIVCVYAWLQGSTDWDTFHQRMTPEEIEKYPITDEQGNQIAKITAKWTDDEYLQKWGKRFEDVVIGPLADEVG